MIFRWQTFVLVYVITSMVRTVTKAVCRRYNYTVLVTFGQSYDTADARCKTRGLSLPVVQSIDEAQQLGDYLQDKGITASVWIALRLPDTSSDPGAFAWPDSSLPAWTHWKDRPGRSEPDNTETDKCVVMNSGLQWETRNCGIAHAYVCQNFLGVVNNIGPAMFTRLEDYELTGQSLFVFDCTTLLRCCARCLSHCDCDVITVGRNGSCSLYPSSALLYSLAAPSEDSVFRIRRSP